MSVCVVCVYTNILIYTHELREEASAVMDHDGVCVSVRVCVCVYTYRLLAAMDEDGVAPDEQTIEAILI